MGKFDTRATFGIDFKVNKTDLDALKRDLQSLNSLSAQEFMAINKGMDLTQARRELTEIKSYSMQVQKALGNAFNTDLGVMNINKLSFELKKLPIDEIYKSFAKAGAQGAAAFNSISSAVLKGNLQLKESNKLLDKIGTTFANTVRFGLASSVFNRMTDSLQRSWNFTKQLDTSLNDIRIVTGKSADEMERFAKTANNAAQKLGATTNDYTKASLIYYQQGLGDAETQARANVTLKTANVTGQQASTVSEQLTAIWNGYKVDAAEAELYIDKVAKVAATTAADLEEMATGMSKVASAANSAGVDIDELNAMLATVISVTREAPETIGTSFRTIFARLGDLKMGGQDEDGLGLGQISQKVSEFGINILDAQGDLRDMGNIITDIASKWEDLSRGERQALAVAAAGKQQYSRFIALFDNWDMYTKALNDSKSAQGELQKQQDIYLESTEAHLNKLTAAQERVGNAFVDNKSINSLIDLLTAATNGAANFVEAIGGGGNVLLTFGSIATRVFDKQIASGINNMINHMQIAKQNARALQIQLEDLKWQREKINPVKNTNDYGMAAGLDAKIAAREQMQPYTKNMSPQNIDQGNMLIDELGNAVQQQQSYEASYQKALTAANSLTGQQYTNIFNDIIEQDYENSPVKKGLDNYVLDIQELSYAIDALPGSIDKYIAASAKMAESTKENESKLESLKDKAETELKNVLENTASQGNYLKDTGIFKGMDPDAAKKMKAQVAKDVKEIQNILTLQNKAEKGEGPLDLLGTNSQWDKKIKGILARITALRDSANTEMSEILKVFDIEDKTKGKEKSHNEKNVENKKEDYQGFLSEQERQRAIADMATIVGSIGQVGSALMSLSNIPTIWNNENLSTMQKFLQTMMSLSMGTTQLITGFQGLAKIGNVYKTVITGVQAATLKKIAGDKIENIEKQKGIALTGAEIVAKKGELIGEQNLTAATWAHVAAKMAENWWMLAAAAAVAVAAVGIYALIKAYNADAEAAKKASETAKDLVDEHTRVAEELDTLKSKFDTYDTAKEKLDKCIKGTQEWNDALKETNKAAIELIDSISGLSGDTIRDLYDINPDTGEIQINEQNAQKVIDKKEDEELAARMAAAAGARDATEASNRAQVQNLMRQNAQRFSERNGFAQANKIIGNLAGFGISGTIGTALGENIIADQDKEAIMSNLDKFGKDQTVSEFKKTLQNLGVNISELNNSELETLQEQLKGFDDSTDAATEKLKLLTQEIANEKLGNKYDGAEKKVASTIAVSQQKSIKEDIIELSHDMWQADNSKHENYQEIASRLSKATGGKYSATTGNTVLGDNNDRRFIFQDENGEKTEEKSEEWVANTIAAYEALEKLEINAKKAEKAFNTLESSMGESFTNGIKNFISTGNLESLTQEEIQKLMGMDKWELAKAMGTNIFEVDKMLGEYDFKQLKDAGKRYKEGLDSITDGVYTAVAEQFKLLKNLNKLTLEEQKEILAMMNAAYATGGDKALKEISDMFEGMTEEEIKKWGSAIKNINWSTITVDQLAQKIKESGIKTEFSNEALERYIQLKNSEIGKIEETIAKYAEVNKIASKMKNLGDTISQEEYSNIYNYLGEEAERYFTRMLDGTYKLIKGADEFQNRTKEIVEKSILTSIRNQQQLLDNSLLEAKEKITNTLNKKQQDEFSTGITTKLYDLSTNNGLPYRSLTLGRPKVTTSPNRFVLAKDQINTLDLNNNHRYGTNPLIRPQLPINIKPENNPELLIGKDLLDRQKTYNKPIALRQPDIRQMMINNQVEKQLKQNRASEANSTLDELEKYANAVNNQELVTKIGEWKNSVKEAGDVTEDVLKGINTTSQNITEQIYNNQLTLANSAESYKELDQLAESDEFKNETGYKAINEASLNMWNENRESGLDTNEIREYAEYIQDISTSTSDFANSLSGNSKAAAKDARDLAIQIMRMNEGVESLADNWDNWKDILNKSKPSSQEYMKAMTGAKEAVADLLDMDKEYVSNSMILDHMKDISLAAKGNEDAIDRLREASLKSVIMSIDFKSDDIKNKFVNTINAIQELAKNQNLSVGARIDTSGLEEGKNQYFNTLQEMMNAGEVTAADVNAALSAIGYTPVYEEVDVPLSRAVPSVTTRHEMTDMTFDDPNDPTRMTGWTEREYALANTPIQAEEGEVQMFSAGTAEKPPQATIKQRKLTGATKKAGGSYNNYSSANARGGAPGKKGGGGSDKKPQKMDKVESKVDRYHKVNTQLSKISNHLEKIQSQEKKFIGTKLIDNLNGQLAKLDKRIDNLREKQKIAYSEADELRGKLSSGGVTFNDDGTINNYMEMYNAKLNHVNGLIDQYNAMSADEQENFKETVEKAKEDFEKWQEDMDRYDELMSDFIPGLENEIQDAIDEEIEINIKKFNLEFEVRLEIADAQKDWNEFKRKILDDIDDDDILGNARARATDDLGVYLSGTDGKDGLLGAGVKQTQSILKELKDMDEKGWSNVYGDDRVSALEDLQEAYQNVEQSLMEIKEIQEDVAQAVLDQMDAVVDAMDKVADLMDTVDSQIEHNIKVIEMVYGETDYDAKGKYMEQRQKNNLDTLGTTKENRDYWEQQMNLIDDKTSEAYQKAQENFFKYNDAVNDAIEKSIEDAQEKAENAIDGIFKKYNDEITNGKGLDYTEQQWELVNDVADQYLDTVNAAFGIRQLEGKWKDAIDQTDNVGAQRKLNALMEEQLKKLREKDKLTEYDIERAEKEYEIALKKLALEEAQQTKSTMRLRRDSQGNYRYEYVADENQIAKLQDELDALENSLYNFDKERWLEMQNQVVDAVRDRQDAIKEILMDASLTEEERLERLEEINRLYNEKIQNITDQAVTAQTNLYDSGATELAKIWDEQGKDFQDLSDEEQRVLVEEMLPQFETGVNDMIDKFSGPGGFEDTTTDSMDALSQATQDYQNDLGDVEDQAGITFDEIRDGQDDVLDAMPDMIDDAEDYVDVMQDELSQLQDINAELQKKLLYYQQISVAAKAAATEAYNYWLKEQQIAAEKYAQENAKKNDNAGGNNGNTGSGGNGGGSGSGNGGKTTLSAYDAVGVAAAISLGQNYGGWGVGQDRANKLAAKFTNDNDVQAVINRNNGYKNSKGEFNAYRDKLENYYYNRFNTGGYTGDWVGDYGKFAMLDRKELVLNAHDTENMLDMLAITRDVVAMAGPRAGLSKIMTPSTDAEVLEQNVHIEANFPAAESAEEIKEAINSLVNLAAQRASRNGRG